MHLHLPLQSGSDRILKEMNRHYPAAHYLEIIESGVMRIFIPPILLWFGETEDDFKLH